MFQFWLVWKHIGPPPTKQHLSEQSARDEAERLAKATPGTAFIVLEAKAVCKVQAPVAWRDIKSVVGHPADCQCDDCTIPF